MNINKLLTELNEYDIFLSIEGEDLLLNYEGDEISELLLGKIKSNKKELVAYLKKYADQEEVLDIQVVEKKEYYPLSSSQYNLWILSQFQKGSAAYNMAYSVRLKGGYDIPNFKRAIWSVLERHEILRTIFWEDSEGQVYQKVLDTSELGFEIGYENYTEEEEPEKCAVEYIQNDFYLPFDLRKAPLLRVCLLQLSDSEYIFHYNKHHTITDGYSMNVLARDVLAYYKHYTEETPLGLPELRIQYKDYVVWQQNQLETEAYKEHKKYWINKLSGSLPVLALPAYKKRPLVKTYNGRQVSTYLSKKDTEGIRAYIKEKGGTMFMFLLASLKVLLHRYTDQEDIIVSSPIAGRDHPELENQIGFYVNTLILRSTITANLSFDEFYEQVKQDLLDAYTHQMYPFGQLSEELGLNKNSSRNGLFDIRVILQNTADNTGAKVLPEEVSTLKDHGASMAKFDTLFIFEEVGDHIKFELTFNTDVYDYDMISKLMNHYLELVNRIIEKTTIDIGELEYLTEQEQFELLNRFNHKDGAYLKDKTIIDLFEEQASKTPDEVAVISGNDRLTYQELNERSSQLANYLQEQFEIAPNDLVGLMAAPSCWSVVSILAIIKSGAAYVPIDLDAPTERIQYVIDDTKVKALIIFSKDQKKFENYIVNTLVIDHVWERIKDTKEMVVLDKLQPENLVYVIYTSGSTGQPKGVMITHVNLIDYVNGLFEYTDIESSKGFALMSNIATDLGNTVLYGSLLSGGTLHLPSKEILRNADDIHEYFDTYSIDCIKIVPSHWKALVKGNDFLLPNRMIVFGGDTLPVVYIEAIKKQNSEVEIINHYGPTETTIGKLLINVDRNTDYQTIPIGKLFSQTSVYVVNQQFNLCPVGVSGELLIGGKGVAKGYLNKPELTKKQFIQNPFSETKEKLYKTGDLVRMLPDGNIEFLGRKDNQVKIRGNRIELGEIESTLSLKKGIDTIFVLAKELDSGDKELVAYYKSSEPIEGADLRSYVQDRLPAYMVPTYFVYLEEIPLTLNGKVDKRALPDPEVSLSTELEYIAPRNNEEQALVEVWESVLKREEISITDNFYDLGGDSIKSILIVSRLKQKGYALKVSDLMQTPVLSKLSGKLTRTNRVINQSIVKGNVLLTPIQESFLSSDSYVDKSHYNQSVALESTSSIDFNLLDKSLEYLVKHHDTLRMVYKNEGGKWYQENMGLNQKKYSLDFYDLSDSHDYQFEMTRLCDILQSDINLEQGPLIKAALFKLKDKDCIILIIHHLVVDGVSWRILLEDLGSVYEGLQQQIKITLPKKTDSFQRWASLLNEYATSDQLNMERSYWEDVLSSDILPIYQDDVSIDLSKGKIKSSHFSLEKEIVELLQTKAHRVYNTEINDVLLAALGISIQRVFGNDSVVLDLEGHGREGIIDGIDITRTVGWFTSLYPFVLKVSKDTSDFTASLIEVKESLRKLPNKGIGYGILRYLGGGFENELRSSIVFNYLGDFGNAIERTEDKDEILFGYSSEYKGVESSKKNNSLGKRLSIAGILVGGVLEVEAKFNDAVYAGQQISDLMESYKFVLREIISQLSEEKWCYLTPSDLTYKDLSLSELSDLNKDNNIEDVYTLSPLQEGLYYHWVSGNEKTTYCAQRSCRLRMPEVTLSNIRKGYELLIARHSVLRTGFSTSYGTLLQIVRKEITDTFVYEDISAMASSGSLELYISDFKLKDKNRGFSIQQDSLMRLSVLDIGNGEYEFIWSNHHILMDGWCSSILINEFYQILISLETERTISLPEVIPYSSYIKWLESINKVSNKSYWRNYLSDYREKASIPFKRLRVPSQNYLGKQEVLKIEASQLEKLRKICVQYNVTENIFMQSAWGYLLSKYNNVKDVVYGSVVSGRPGAIDGVEDMVGLFINTIPVRINYDNNMTVSDLLSKRLEDSIASLDHHYLNLSEVQSESVLGNDLLDHIYVFENYAENELEEDFVNANKEKLSVESGQNFIETHYDFNVLIVPTNDYIEIRLRYNGNIYCRQNIIQIRDHLKHILSSFVEDPQMLLEDVSYLTESELLKVLNDFNGTEIRYPKNKTILDLFKEQVDANPDKIAVVFKGVELTYKKLDERSNQLSNYLKNKYLIEINDLVGIKLERSEWMLISILGVLKNGGAYVPLDVKYPEERIQFIQKDSNYKVCIDQGFINCFESEKEEYSKSEVEGQVQESGLAYGIYTSGSTGKPKGVINEHAGLYNRLLWMRDDFKISEADVILQKTPYTFDVSVWELLMPSITGCCLVFAKPEGHKDPEYLQQIIKESKVSIIHFVPSMLGVFLENLEPESCRTLRHVVCSGEILLSNMVEEFKEKLPWVRIHNLYGPTEAAIDVTSIDLTDVNTKEKGVSIGKPVANTRIYIVDKDLSPQSIDVPGELLIGGIQIAQGYLNRPDLNVEKFIPSPFTKGERIYRTGDLAKWLSNGEIAYIGRIDDQVKIRGNRIELGEIESKMQSSGYVDNAVVLVRGESSRKYLVGYVIAKEEYTEDALYDYLTTHLPDYMVPSQILILEELPLTSSGKVDRKVLLAMEDDHVVSDQYVAARNEMEEGLVRIWEEVLEYEGVGVRSNFFRIGGDSILSIRLISKINKKYNTSLTIAQLYELNTIERLCKQIEEGTLLFAHKQSIKDEIEKDIQELKESVLSEIDDSHDIEDIYPMSDIQKGMVTLSSLNPESGVYHDQFIFQIPTINKKLFREAFSKLIWKHATLRTQFNLTFYQTPIQIVKKKVDFTIDFRNIKDLGTKEQEAYIQKYMLSERSKPFQFDSEFLWRISLFEVNNYASMFLFQFHHAILDGWSVASLNTELFQIYRQLESKVPLKIEELKVTNRGAIIEELYDQRTPEFIDFWKIELDEYKKLDIFRNENQILTNTYSFDFSFKYRLESKCREDSISLKTAVYSAFIYALKALNYEDDFVVGMVTNNRPAIEDGDKLLGCFLNTIPVRNKLNDVQSLSWTDFFKKTENHLTKIKKNERLTLYEISKLTNEETIGGSPFFDVIFNYVNFHIYDSLDLEADKSFKKSQEEEINTESFEATNTSLDLTVNLESDSLILKYKLKRGLKNNLTLEKIHRYVEQGLLNYITNLKDKVKDTEFLSSEEIELLSGFNATETKYSESTTVLDLMATRVQEERDAPAVSFEGSTMSYKELDEHSNQLANYLAKKYKVKKNDLVGVQLDRNREMLIGILGILKVGGAYVPMGMQYPKERVRYIQEDSGYKVCINESFLAEFKSVQKGLSKKALTIRVDGSDLAYGIYTSGSTGNPKGVVNAHAGLYNRLLWMRDDLKINQKDVILQKTPYTFDVSVWELLMPSITGCHLVFAKPEGHKDPGYLQQIIKDSQVSIIHFVPSMLRVFLDNIKPENCGTLRHVICSGEVLPSSTVEEFKEKLPWARIHNLYGPTEAGIDVTSIDLTDIDTVKEGVSIGKPVANTKIYIVDKHLSQQPIGVPGELLIEGIQVAQGYLNSPDLNEEKFIPSPFTEGERIYRTGDLARWLPNGEIVYIGRLDNQVKIRGNRIELGEIEVRIQSFKHVDNAAVVIRESENGNKFLVAYVIAKKTYTEDSMRNYLTTHLPDYMVPSPILIIEKFPLTSNGKVDRKGFPDFEKGQIVSEKYVAPRNEMEERLVKIWEEVLDYQGIGVCDNFFRVGGDSIQSIRLIGQINKKFEVNLTIAQLYQSNTIEGLCEQIETNADFAEENKELRENIKVSFGSLMDDVINN
ncbi:amino acid adenylation domain-containing protein [Aquimarina sp. W85]|uniref:amino acid adenylation domain-containing protein n=1 Tax=Aquimarina rhodophyticola TaxID=3342246 RepID=UPI0036728D04